jgi:hypothetical protein
MWNPAGAATTSAAATAIDKVTSPPSFKPQHPHPHRHVAAGLFPTDAAAGVGMVAEAAVAGLTDESVVLIAQTLGRGLQVRVIYTQLGLIEPHTNQTHNLKKTHTKHNQQILDLEACAAVTDRGVLALFASCHRLQRLVLSGLPCITDACLHALLPSPPSSPAAADVVVG